MGPSVLLTQRTSAGMPSREKRGGMNDAELAVAVLH